MQINWQLAIANQKRSWPDSANCSPEHLAEYIAHTAWPVDPSYPCNRCSSHTHIQCTQLRFALQQDDTAAASSALTVDVSMNQAYWGYRWPSSFAGSEQAPGTLRPSL